MMHSRQTFCRAGGIVALALWITSNFLWSADITEASRYAARTVEPIRGSRLSMQGWLGPLGLSFAWYAHVPFFYCTWSLFHVRAKWWASVVAFILAATALLPHATYSEVVGWRRAYFVGPATWTWLSSFAVNLAIAGLSKEPRQGTDRTFR
jgi:hypothetical protein